MDYIHNEHQQAYCISYRLSDLLLERIHVVITYIASNQYSNSAKDMHGRQCY